MQKKNQESLKKINQGRNTINKLIYSGESEIRRSEFIVKDEYKYSILQWRYQKKLDSLLERLQKKFR
ncbi:MAG: hypothetical protein ACFE94_05220 [Candidatus Hodarchaeota archaeon]